MNNVILLTDEMIVTREVAAGSFKLEQTAKARKFHIKAPAGSFVKGDLAPVARDVNRRVGTGRRSYLEHHGYTVVEHEVTGAGDTWYNAETDSLYQNFYFD